MMGDPRKAFLARERFSFQGQSMTRQPSDSTGLPDTGIVTLKLSEEGHLEQEGTDVKIEVLTNKFASIAICCCLHCSRKSSA